MRETNEKKLCWEIPLLVKLPNSVEGQNQDCGDGSAPAGDCDGGGADGMTQIDPPSLRTL